MWNKVMLKNKNYISETDGNVAMMFAATVVMLLTGIGAAVDFSNLSRAQNTLQAQVDAGVFAAATFDIDGDDDEGDDGGGDDDDGDDRSEREKAAHEVVEANGYDLSQYKPVLTVKKNSVELRAELDYKPIFGRILGIDKVRLEATAESGLPGSDAVDIVLVLDNTRSMEVEGKMDALKNGANKLVEAIEDSNSESKIGLVPFARYVRLNDSARNESWFEMPTEFDTPRTWQQATHTGGSCTIETDTRRVDGVEISYEKENCTGQTTTYEEQSTTVESRWDGCVGTRLPPYSERDDAYSHKVPGLLNIIPTETTGLSRDRWSYCPSEIIPVTDDYDRLKSRINGMWTTDNTYLPSGLIWGQRVLSSGVPFDNSPENGEQENRKIMVLMTDGNNTTRIVQDSVSEAEYKAPPYIANVPDDEVSVEANAATSRICQSAKSSGIEIYTIAFKVSDPATKTLLRNCASSPSKALNADNNAALIKSFEKVAKSVKSDIRLWR